MNKTLLSTALVAILAAAGFAPTAQAVDGTINITGQVVGQTCQVENTAYGTQATKSVTLPLVLAPVLGAAGTLPTRPRSPSTSPAAIRP